MEVVDGDIGRCEIGIRRKCDFEAEPVPVPKLPRCDIIDGTPASLKKDENKCSTPRPAPLIFRSGSELDPKIRAQYRALVAEETKNQPPRVLHSCEEIVAMCEKEDKVRAEIAVKQHNARLKPGEGPELELVEPLDSNPFVRGGIWMHLNFIAKPKNASDDEKKRYFTELKHIGVDEELLTVFCSVEPEGVSPVEMTQGCRACTVGHQIYHPPSGSFTPGPPQHYSAAIW